MRPEKSLVVCKMLISHAEAAIFTAAPEYYAARSALYE